MEKTGEEIKRVVIICALVEAYKTPFYLHIVVACSYSVTSIQVWHIMKMSLKPKRSNLHSVS